MLLERGLPKEALPAFEATLNKEPHRLGPELGAGAAAEKSGDADKARAITPLQLSLSRQLSSPPAQKKLPIPIRLIARRTHKSMNAPILGGGVD
jgi:hypothetical protein